VYRKHEQFGCQIAQPRRKWDLAELFLTNSKQKTYSRPSWGRHSHSLSPSEDQGFKGKVLPRSMKRLSAPKNFCFESGSFGGCSETGCARVAWDPRRDADRVAVMKGARTGRDTGALTDDC